MGDVASRIRSQRLFLQFFLRKLATPDEYQGKCYWCSKDFDLKTFDCSLDDPIDATIHHKDENRSNDSISNLVLIHRSCHQRLHKEATRLGFPAAITRELLVKTKEGVDLKATSQSPA